MLMDHAEAVRTLAAERYLLDEMPPEERDAFETHFFDCRICAEAVESGAMIAEGARDPRTFGQARVVPFPARERGGLLSSAKWLPLAAAAVLALVAGYQSLVTIPALREAAERPGAFVPVALAPTSRGEGPSIERPGDWLVLALDINADPVPSNLVYDLRTLAGDVLLTDHATAPPQGTPLFLRLPGSLFTSGQYALVVRDEASPATEVGIYRFAVR
jgi:hypothetical protein